MTVDGVHLFVQEQSQVFSFPSRFVYTWKPTNDSREVHSRKVAWEHEKGFSELSLLFVVRCVWDVRRWGVCLHTTRRSQHGLPEVDQGVGCRRWTARNQRNGKDMQEVRHFAETTPTTLSLTNLFVPTQTAAWLHILVLACYADLHITWKYNDVCQQQVFIEMSPAIEIIFKFDRLLFLVCFDCFDQDLLGAALKAPLTSYETIYTLPMLSIKESKGKKMLSLLPLLNTRTEIASLVCDCLISVSSVHLQVPV